MSDEVDNRPVEEPSAEVLSPVSAKRVVAAKPGTGWGDARSRFKDLVVVFFGVYAAFLLNRYESDRRDAQRRTQILQAIEHEINDGLEPFKEDMAHAEIGLAELQRRIERGEMPHLPIVYTNSSYNAGDDTALLQAGGLELLDVQTIELLRKANNLQRVLQAGTHNQFELCLAQLTNHSTADFYDPATHQLKAEYRWYPHVLSNTVADAKATIAAQEALLTHLRLLHPQAQTAPSPAPSSAGPTTPPRSPAASSPAA